MIVKPKFKWTCLLCGKHPVKTAFGSCWRCKARRRAIREAKARQQR